MQPRVTVALATVWLVVGLVGGTVTLRLPHDQYSPASPRNPGEIQRDQTEDWKDHDSAEDQPLDLWIGSQRSISAEESPGLPRSAKFVERGFPLEDSSEDIVSSKRVYPLSSWQRRLPSITDTEFAADKVDYGEMPETLSRAAVVPPSDSLDDPFVADDTFQDQGPGSVEIYKLDLSKEKALLTATTPSANLSLKIKNKAPKKTGRLDATKTKGTDIKPSTTTTTTTTIDSKIHYRQSNFFDEQQTETPMVNRNAFDVGGVPELQVGCEGLEASPSFHKAKRSINTPDKKKEEEEMSASVLLDVTPISLDFDYDLSYDEADFEEMDELLKLKRLETTTKRNRPNRGDMDASHLNSDHLDEPRRPEKLPVRGDLGDFTAVNSSGASQGESWQPTDSEIKNRERIKVKREPISLDDDDGANRGRGRGRRLLWLAAANTEGFADSVSERKRAKRSIDWGFGENEGVVSSDELQTVNERRRQHEMRYHQDGTKRRDQHRETNPETDNIRRQYEQLQQQKQREEEERLRRMQQGGDRRALNRTQDRWEKEERRRNEMRRRKYEEYRRRTDSMSRANDGETQQRQMEDGQRQETVRNRTQEIARRNEEERRRQEEEERRRRLQKEEEQRKQIKNTRRPGFRTPVSDEEKRRRVYDEETQRREEAKRQDRYRSREEAQRRKEAEERLRQEDFARNFSEDDRRRVEERRREWAEKRKQEEEDERRRQKAPSNLMHAGHRVSQSNDIGQRDRDEERRRKIWEQEERRREQKLQEYIARNRPINVSRAEQRSEEDERRRMNAGGNHEEYRKRLEERRRQEERRLHDYIRRNQPVNLPKSNATGHNLLEQRRRIEEARHRGKYPDPGVKRHRGPSASTYIDPRSSPEEVRRRQQEMARRLEQERRQGYEAEERRKELARRQREEEEERRLREERVREEETKREEEARSTQSRRYEEDRKRLEAARLQAERRRQEMLKERSRSEAGRTRRPEATRPTYYQDSRLLEHRIRQESRPIPSNLILNQAEARRATSEHERQEADRRREEENRMRGHRWKETDQWRRQELARLNSLPVSARIIVRPGGSSSSPVSPPVISRGGFTNEINFTGINPNRQGVPAPKFPAPPTSRPPIKGPGPCVWAVVQCCSSNNNRLVNCFESMGCPGINWDPNPCRGAIAQAARNEVMKFYANAENQ